MHPFLVIIILCVPLLSKIDNFAVFIKNLFIFNDADISSNISPVETTSTLNPHQKK